MNALYVHEGVASATRYGVTVEAYVTKSGDVPMWYEIRGPRFKAILPAQNPDGCRYAPCPKSGPRHTSFVSGCRQLCHCNAHPETIRGWVEGILATYGPSGQRRSVSRPKAHTKSPFNTHYSRGFVELPGEECVTVHTIPPRRDVVTDQLRPAVHMILCDAKQCFTDENHVYMPELGIAPARALIDQVEAPPYRGGAYGPDHKAEAEKLAEAHRQWHVDTYGVHPRVTLDRWIYRMNEQRWEDQQRWHNESERLIAELKGKK